KKPLATTYAAKGDLYSLFIGEKSVRCLLRYKEESRPGQTDNYPRAKDGCHRPFQIHGRTLPKLVSNRCDNLQTIDRPNQSKAASLILNKGLSHAVPNHILIFHNLMYRDYPQSVPRMEGKYFLTGKCPV